MQNHNGYKWTSQEAVLPKLHSTISLSYRLILNDPHVLKEG
jgi:hypothetical protein